MSIFSIGEYEQEADREVKDREWKGRQFRTSGGSYLDRATKPLFNTSHSLYHLRDTIAKILPDGYIRPQHDKVMMPFAESLSTFWTGGVGVGALNQSYSPFAVFYYVLRDHTNSLITMCDGRIISNQNEYNTLVNLFNEEFYRILEGRGHGTIRGYCSEDEMVRLGTLFFMIMSSCDHRNGLILNEDRCLMNDWCGRSVTIDFDPKAMDQYKAKLKRVVMSDMHWQQFMFRYLELTDENTLWMFNVPKFMSKDKDESVHQWFTEENFIDLIDMLPLIMERRGSSIMVVRDTPDFIKTCANLFNFVSLGDGRWRNGRGIYLTQGFETVGEKYSIITNYAI